MRPWQIAQLSTAASNPGARNLYLPERIDLIAGQPFSLYWLGLAHLRTIGAYTFTVQGPGTSDSTHWTWTPAEAQVRRIVIRAFLSGVLVGTVVTSLHVHAATGHAGSKRLNFNGDSITATNLVDAWTNVATRLITTAGPTWTAHGTLVNPLADAGVRCEGHPGRTFAFLNGDVADDTRVCTFTNGTDLITYVGDVANLSRVRFSNSGGALPTGISAALDYWTVRQSGTTSKVAATLAEATAGTPVIDITTNGTGTTTMYVGQTPYKDGGAAYVTKWGAGTPFTDVVLAMGVNDFNACREDHPEDSEAVIAAAESLIVKIRAGSPSCRVYVCTQYNPSSEDDDFGTPGTAEAAQYDLRRLTAQPYMYGAFAGRESESIYMVPLNACLDPVGDFDDNNVHPNSTGHPRVGRLVAGAIIGRAA